MSSYVIGKETDAQNPKQQLIRLRHTAALLCRQFALNGLRLGLGPWGLAFLVTLQQGTLRDAVVHRVPHADMVVLARREPAVTLVPGEAGYTPHPNTPASPTA